MLFGEENVRAIQLPSMAEMNDDRYVTPKKYVIVKNIICVPIQ